MAFKKTIEDLTCSHCGTAVKGTGYTNHCPKCLYSKHVDVTPGDRAATCHGEMEPIRIEGTTGKGYSVRHKCSRCGMETVTRSVPEDDVNALIALSAKVANS